MKIAKGLALTPLADIDDPIMGPKDIEAGSRRQFPDMGFHSPVITISAPARVQIDSPGIYTQVMGLPD